MDNLKDDYLHLAPIVDIAVFSAWQRNKQAIVVEVSIKERPGLFKREWALTQGLIDTDQELDLRAWVDSLVGDAILMSLGVQGSLGL